MRRFFLVAIAAAGVTLACRDAGITGPREQNAGPAGTHVPGSCTTYPELVSLTGAAFGSGSPNVNSALSKLSNLEHHFSTKHDVAAAQAKAYELVGFILQKHHDRPLPGGESAVHNLVAKIFCYVGLSLTVSDVDNAWVVTPEDGEETLIRDDGQAGVRVPAGAVDRPTLIQIAPIPFTSTLPGAGPLDTRLDQYPGFFHFTSSAPFVADVIVGVCPASTVPSDVRARLRLGHDASTGFEITPAADASFLTCAASSQNLLPSFSRNVSYAAGDGQTTVSGGVGGTAGEFSDFGTVDPVLKVSGGVGGTAGEFNLVPSFNRVLAAADDCPTDLSVGASVDPACRPTVTIKTELGTALANVPVTFTVTAGGGSVAPATATGCGTFGTSAVATTDANGRARVCWTMGTGAGANTIVATPAAGGDAPDGVTFEPPTHTFTINAIAGDTTPPVIGEPVITGTVGNGGWYTSNVSFTFPVSDPESQVQTTGCEGTLAADTPGQTFTCTASSAGGQSSRSVTIKRDASRPTVTANMAGTVGNNDWFTSDVDVSFAVSANGPSGLGALSDCASVSVTSDGTFSFTCTAASGAGLTSAATAAGKRDATKPVITFSGNAGAYTVDQSVEISCDASDATSGIAAQTCPSMSSAAYLLALGSHTLSASATDNAGNSATKTTTFTLTATYTSVCNLVRQWVTNSGVAVSLCTKLRNAEAAAARGNANAKAGMLNAFGNEVRAQSGKHIPSAIAPHLLRFAAAL